ncbi:MNIO family bufferin maturase [Rhodoplanes sp. Z2-YC6860]|uniref:MNIO family bufferin maturase n=1 Tax=Rhodoplanes sp. Z2-YC6860 TaxID=674703 RepID=UPI00078DA6B4|nr:DUF692 domain-containing protein [Rhodoplanes sp. Z2-YC6860]AMN45030.1 hypothetical protein RHPLAN_66240 [Rhodoplanes sp. Z2-YC6860]
MAHCIAGTGLKPEHADDIFAGARRVDFFEIHAENYMGAGGPPHHLLRRIRADYPLSIHGVGLSIGGTAPLDRAHLMRLKRLVRTYEPALFSEHLAWSTHDGVFLNDLLPLPYNDISLAHVCAHVNEVQDTLGMRMLLENPSTYVAFGATQMSEIEFLGTVAQRTGCGLLLDVNNVHVSAVNHGFDAGAYIDDFPIQHVGQFHLAGFAEDRDSTGAELLIDNHGQLVADIVWDLYRQALAHGCLAPTLVEWDNNLPPFETLTTDVERARTLMLAQAADLKQAA